MDSYNAGTNLHKVRPRSRIINQNFRDACEFLIEPE
jgi:hypothetical protein